MDIKICYHNNIKRRKTGSICNLLKHITSKLVSECFGINIFLLYLAKIANTCAKFEKNDGHIGFKDMSFLHKIKVALNSSQLSKNTSEQKPSPCSLYGISLNWSKIAYF